MPEPGDGGRCDGTFRACGPRECWSEMPCGGAGITAPAATHLAHDRLHALRVIAGARGLAVGRL